jgi:hypothetical protein
VYVSVSPAHPVPITSGAIRQREIARFGLALLIHVL